jgi:hypothetical protein
MPIPLMPPEPCGPTHPAVAALVVAVALLCLATFTWMLVTSVWDDIRSRVRSRGDSGRGRDVLH